MSGGTVSPYLDASSLATISGLTVAAGITMLAFRLQREIYVREKFSTNSTWLPPADRFLIAALFIATFCVLLPLILSSPGSLTTLRLACSGCAASIVMLAVYPMAIFAHYDLSVLTRNIERSDRSSYNLRAENFTVALGSIVAILVALYSWFR